MKIVKKFLVFIVSFLFIFPFLTNTHAQEFQQMAEPEFLRAVVIEIKAEGENEIEGRKYPFQVLKLRLTTGQNSGSEIEIEHGKNTSIFEDQKVKVNEEVVLVHQPGMTGQGEYALIDNYRLDTIKNILVIFFIVVILIAGIKGIGSIVGLGLSLLVIIEFIVPQLLTGKSAFQTILLGALAIITVTLFLAHGFSKKTLLALISTYITLVLVVVLSIIAVDITSLTGMGSEDAYQLRFSNLSFNFKGLLLGGMIIATLGILDDITTAQTALVFELKKANEKLSLFKLFRSGMNVGKEHIASLVNTLVLAYAGVSLPVFIFFVLNPANQPLWFILNNEEISQEIIRSIVGSLGLIFAVPITTFIAAVYATRYKIK